MKRKNKQPIISTGSTLLDLAISGGMYPEGGIPPGVLVEIFGPPGSGKTVLLCEIAGNIQRDKGNVMFRDPEARLNKTFAKLFGVDMETAEYACPDTVAGVFKPVREWRPANNNVHGIFADSLAALSTDWEMEDKDQYGMRRAKEFSEELRKTCRIIKNKNYLMVCSNQVRENLDAGPYGQKYKSPGGLSIGFYSSLRLRCNTPTKIKKKVSINGKEHVRIIGIQINVEVYKNSIWKPHYTAPLSIIFDYGIDDIRENLQYIKEKSKNTLYTVNETKLSNTLEDAILIIERENLEDTLKKQVIQVWKDIEDKFIVPRKGKYNVN